MLTRRLAFCQPQLRLQFLLVHVLRTELDQLEVQAVDPFNQQSVLSLPVGFNLSLQSRGQVNLYRFDL